MAASITPYGRMTWTHDSSSAWVGFNADGTLLIRSAVPDHGGGQASSLCSIASEVLGLPMKDIAVFIGDTHLNPPAGTTTATRQLTMSGNATHLASTEVRGKLLQVASEVLEVGVESLDLADGRVFVKEAPARSAAIAEIVKASRVRRVDLSALSTFYAPASASIDRRTGRGKAFNDYTYGVMAAEVLVDRDTGTIQVTRLVSSFDVGRCVNRASVEGQLEGGAAMGLGQALMEEVVFSDGVTLTDSLHSYLIPTSMDVPEVQTVIFESGSGQGPFGAKGIGEPSLTPAVAAIANAVADALGAPVHTLPITPERVLEALRRRPR
jgi:CO/xanthine dehydrogenase Mo-binding subunit